MHDDPVVDEALEWFARMRDGEADAAVEAEFALWRGQSARHAREYDAVVAIWGSRPFGDAAASMQAGAAPAPAAWPGPPPRPARRRAAWSIAAAAIVLLSIGILQYPALMLRWQADYLTQTGDRRTVQLPDGSSMTLDTASAVSIDFRDGRRQVRLLEGEAFFDVKHDPARPFRVQGRFSETEVHGTAFAVGMASEDDRVILETGRVNVSLLADRTNQVKLAPGEMVVATSGALSAVTRVDPESALAWRQGRIIFENQVFSRVLDELRRYYPGRVIVADSRVGRLRVTGNYRLDDIEGAIRTLADATGVTMNRLPGGLIILH